MALGRAGAAFGGIPHAHLPALPAQRVSHRRAFLEPILGSAEMALGGASPGQMAQALLKLKLVADASQTANRQVLQDGFGVEAPLTGEAAVKERPAGKMRKGTTTK